MPAWTTHNGLLHLLPVLSCLKSPAARPSAPIPSDPSPQVAIASSSDVAVDVTRSIGLSFGVHAAETPFISMMVVATGNSRR